jgi:drug/metabolite transporter (DMT)-like permease
VTGRPGLAGELGHRHGISVPERRRMPGGQDEVHRVSEQLVALQAGGQPPRLVPPLVAQHEVDVAQRQGGQRLLGLGLDQLATQPWRVARERLHRGQGEAQRHRLEPGDPAPARDGAGGRGQVGLGERHAREQRFGVVDQHERRVGQAHAAAGALEQAYAGLALEHRELLRDGRRRELQRVGDRGDRAALVQLAQQAQTPEVEHRAATLPIHLQKSKSIVMRSPARMRAMRSSGTVLCLGSGAAFGAMAVFGKLAYDDGATVGTLLAVRFVLAAALFWTLVLAGGGERELRALGRRDVGIGLALGGCGYAIQAGCYFAALRRIDASLLSLLLYTFPAIVAVAAVALGRERIDGRRPAALGLALGGLALVVAGTGPGALDPLGAALALGAAVAYSTYILVGEGIAGRVQPRVLSALVCTGAAASLTAGSALLGELRPGELTIAGWGWLVCLAVVSTVAAISLFFAGLRRAGPTTASILATVEPLVTVLLAFLVFGETLGSVQVVGGALVLAAVPALHARRPRRRRARGIAGAGVRSTLGSAASVREAAMRRA